MTRYTTCPVCDGRYAVTRTGRIRAHKPAYIVFDRRAWPDNCRGSTWLAVEDSVDQGAPV